MKYILLTLCSFLLFAIQAKSQANNYFGGNKHTQDSIRTLLENMEEPTLMNRGNYGRVASKFGKESIQAKQALRKLLVDDSLHILSVIDIYRKFGWPNASQIGWPAVNTAALQIQHADLPVQEEFLSIFKKAAEKGEFNKAVFATLEDRVLIGRGKKQLYGTQWGARRTKNGSKKVLILPIRSPKKLNKRRLEMGLEELKLQDDNYDHTAKVKDFGR